MTLQQFENNIKAVCPDVYHLAAPAGLSRYVVWHEYGTSSLSADDRSYLRLPKVQLDILTQEEYDPLVADICGVLFMMNIPYTDGGTGYDPDYNAIRTILQVVV